MPGVPMPGPGDWVSWGLVENTRIGYVYVRAWTGNAGTEFTTAMDSLLNFHRVEGLIFDFRTNSAGTCSSPTTGSKVVRLHLHVANRRLRPALRSGSRRHVSLLRRPGSSMSSRGCLRSSTTVRSPCWSVRPRSARATRSPISSASIRGRDFFGKPTAAAFNAPITTATVGFPLPGWFAPLAVSESYNVSAPGEYLTHDEFPVDEPVWLTPESVARGEDDVVRAALEWIGSGHRDAVGGIHRDPTRSGRRAALELRRARTRDERRDRACSRPRRPVDDSLGGGPERGRVTVAIDASADRGETYSYRLSVTLSDGTQATFGPVSSGAVAVAESRLEMSPNPASVRSGSTSRSPGRDRFGSPCSMSPGGRSAA